ncbi:vWA domain-containing protein [Thomasclavelia cocleata]|uniref:vWA domain-containing protein n=1 Tax=Thomasclavelia cocleata TaxID=69824 RepID=UPI00272CB75B|nr:vWA domain-containing protein [Thomasclavelia cocleata]
MYRKKIGLFLFAILISLSGLINVKAEKNTTYKPLDLVVIVDASGSMKKADENKIVLQSVSSLISMMPTDSQLGIVAFKENATTISELTPLNNYNNADNLKQMVKKIEYDGKYTAIGNALARAKEVICGKNTRKDAQKAIVLFTDGTDDLVDYIEQEKNNENLNDTIVWGSQNDCPIYTIGFNYKNSMSEGKEGIKKLEKISGTTKALSPKIANNNISEIEDFFIDVLANMCGIQHSIGKTIDVNSAVNEVDIRIKANSKEEMSNGIIHLIDPENKEVSLKNGKSLQYNKEETSAFIKLIKPDKGEWKVEVENFNGEVIVSYIQHYMIDLDLDLPKKGYKGKDIEIKAQLIDQNGKNVKNDVYESLSTAKAIVTERMYPDDKSEIDLHLDNGYLKGTYTIKEENVIEIEVVVASNSINKKVNGEIYSEIKPLELKKDKELEKVTVKEGDTTTIGNIIKDYIEDNGQEYVTAKVEVEDSKIAEVNLDNKREKLTIKGIKYGSTLGTIIYTDAQNNKLEIPFSIKVRNIFKELIPYAGIIAFILFIVILVLFSLEKSRKIKGVIKMKSMTINSNGMQTVINSSVELPATVIFRNTKTLKRCIRYYIKQVKTNEDTVSKDVELLERLFKNNSDLEKLFSLIKVRGTYFGKKGFTLKVKKGNNIRIGNSGKYGNAFKRKFESKDTFTIWVKNKSNDEVKVEFIYNKNKRI